MIINCVRMSEEPISISDEISAEERERKAEELSLRQILFANLVNANIYFLGGSIDKEQFIDILKNLIIEFEEIGLLCNDIYDLIKPLGKIFVDIFHEALGDKLTHF